MNIDVDIILIAFVVVLVLVVIAKIAIQRYRVKHAQLANNVREVGSAPAKTSSVSKVAMPPNKAKEEIFLQDEPEAKDDTNNNVASEKTAETPKEDSKEEKIEESEDGIIFHDGGMIFDDEPVKQSAPEPVKTTKKENAEPIIDYARLVNDPVSIFTDKSAPKTHRIEAIREAGYQKLESAVPDLINALYEDDESISLVAAESLGNIGDPRAIEPLMEVARKNDEEISKTVEEYIGGALMVVDGQQPVNEGKKEEATEETENPYKFKEMVVFTMDQLPKDYFQPDGTPISRKDIVIKGLKDNNEQLRQMAAKAAIGIEETEEVIEPLSEALNNNLESDAIRAMAAEALGGMNTAESTEALIKALKSENVAVRYASTVALCGHSEPKVVEALIGATKDDDKFVRSSAAYALGTTGATVALKALIKCAEDENEVVRFSAVKAISTYSFEEVLKRLPNRDIVKETKGQVLAKIEVLAQFKDSSATEIIKNYLEDPDSDICYKASMALMGEENPELIEQLIEASKRFDTEIYQMAQEQMGSEAFSEVTKFNSSLNIGKSSFGSRYSEADRGEESTNASVPPSRSEAIQNAADFVKNKIAKKSEAVLNINPDDYSGDIIFDDEPQRGFANEDLEAVPEKQEVIVQLDSYGEEENYPRDQIFDQGAEVPAYDQPVVNATQADDLIFDQGTNSVFGNQQSPFDTGLETIVEADEVIPEIIDNEDLPLDQINNLSPEFDKLRKKLLDASPNVRGSAANSLGGFGPNPEALLLLRASLKDENELVRAAVVKSLGQIANSEALDLILTCEKDISTEVRYAVVKALAEIPDYSATEALKRMATTDRSIDVKRNARIALENQG